jgi:hypothetical protein
MPREKKLQLDLRVRNEVARGAETADYFSTVPAAELQAILRRSQTLPIEKLVNTRTVRIDVPQQRIFRDVYWKGSFAADSLLGWEERERTGNLHPEVYQHGKTFAGGSFWKRFDQVKNGVAAGQVVNYNIEWLPGVAEVRTVPYPNGKRAYFRKGQPILLLNYRNDPYRPVYDTFKIIDEENVIGVMHIGEFPNGVEFATFVMARHNYPFEMATDEDRKLIAAASKKKKARATL